MMKSRLAFAAFAIFSIFSVLLYGTTMSYLFFYAIILTALFSLLSVLMSPFFIETKQCCDKTTIMKNEDLLFHVEMTNRSFFLNPIVSFVFYNRESIQYDRHNIPLAPKSKTSQEHVIQYKHRGVYQFGIQYFAVMDCFGLFKMKCRIKDKMQITVYPNTGHVDHIPLKSDLLSKGLSNNDFFQDHYADVTSTRKYEPSDDLRNIHWKLSAKKNELMVKNFQTSILNKVMVVLDTKTVPLQGIKKVEFEDEMVCQTAAVIHYCLHKNLPVEFVYGIEDYEKSDIRSEAELGNTYALLAALPFAENIPFEELLECMLEEEGGFLNIVLLTKAIDSELFKSIRRLFSMGHNVIVFHFEHMNVPTDKKYLIELQKMGVQLIEQN